MHARTHMYACMHAYADVNHFYLKVSYLKEEVLLALKMLFAGLDFYTESAVRIDIMTVMHCGS